MDIQIAFTLSQVIHCLHLCLLSSTNSSFFLELSLFFVYFFLCILMANSSHWPVASNNLSK